MMLLPTQGFVLRASKNIVRKCHAECNEASTSTNEEILRCAQDDRCPCSFCVASRAYTQHAQVPLIVCVQTDILFRTDVQS